LNKRSILGVGCRDVSRYRTDDLKGAARPLQNVGVRRGRSGAALFGFKLRPIVSWAASKILTRRDMLLEQTFLALQ